MQDNKCSWLKGYDPDHLARKLEAMKTVDASGKVVFKGKGFEFREYVVVLNSMVKFSNDIPQLERRGIISIVPFNVGAKGEITSSALLKEIRRLGKKYIEKPLKKYFLITSISASAPHFYKLKRIKINGCTITFYSRRPEKFSNEISEIQKKASYTIFGEFPHDYTHVKVGVSAKSYAQAIDKAIDALDLIRGFWNLFYNRKCGFRMSFDKRKPVNNFVLGPLHTLHLPNGKLATETYWYEPDYRGPLKVHDPRVDIDRLYRFQDKIRRLLKKCRYRSTIEAAILRYTRALDLIDWEGAFLRLWGVLEQLTFTEKDRYDVTIKRASFLFRDREYTKQVLNHLRDYRNRAVHAGEACNEIETFMYQLKNYVEVLLEFHISNRFGFKNLIEVSQFLDSPRDSSDLNSRLQLLRNAQKFLYPSHPKT